MLKPRRCARPQLRLFRRSLVAAALGLALASASPVWRALCALTVLAQLVSDHHLDPLARRVLSVVDVGERTLQIDGRPVPALRYRPRGTARRPGVVLLHGVHPRGIHEPRLQALARALAAGGLDVLTPELTDLLSYRLEVGTVHQIERLSAWHAAATSSRAVGVIGISFAGGLSLMAANDQVRPGPIAFVVAVGAHHDLLRLCRYYAGEAVRGPRGELAQVLPHPYGARVMIREHLARFFSSDDLPIAQRALDTYLQDRHSAARALAKQLSVTGRQTMSALLDRERSAALSELLLRTAAAARTQLMAASPRGRLQGLAVPVFLVHGSADPVIPSIESRFLARELPRPWLRALVISPLLRHAEFDAPPTLGESFQLVRLMMGIFAAAGSSLGPAAGP